MKQNDSSAALESVDNLSWLKLVRDQASSLRFGVIQIVIHDSRVVQIERTEKVRLDKKPSGN